MKTSEVIAHFKTQTATARALGILQSSVSTWPEYPPRLRQIQIEMLTKGALKAEADCFARPKPAAERV